MRLQDIHVGKTYRVRQGWLGQGGISTSDRLGVAPVNRTVVVQSVDKWTTGPTGPQRADHLSWRDKHDRIGVRVSLKENGGWIDTIVHPADFIEEV